MLTLCGSPHLCRSVQVDSKYLCILGGLETIRKRKKLEDCVDSKIETKKTYLISFYLRN